MKLSVIALISGSGTNLQAIIDAAREEQSLFEIAAVISNRADAYGLERARRAGIPAELIVHTEYPDRTAFDKALQELIDRYLPGLVVMAGFMRILTPGFIEHYQGRIFNIHPSLLPAFKGLHTHQRALDAGVKEHGASVHFATEELDSGAVIIQAKVPVLPGDTAETLGARVLKEEHRIYPQAIHWFAQGRLQFDGKHALLDGRKIENPLVNDL
ncbi:MAG: phosphoribosylglycinamide formyltransferase [Gammaproteobacteria bacterium]|nr:phosphoribosylglycinamide formyltransferase [Gammaproteobacteria bacterium]